jgi:dihydrofolate reductase
MRDVILYMSMSLDGFVGGDREHPGIAIPEGAELKQWKLDHISKAGAHLMGRTSYQEMSSYWPQSDDEYAAPMNDIPKVVFSKTLSDAEATLPVNRVARGDLATELPGSRHLNLVEALSFPSGIVVHVYRPQHT